MKFLRLFAIGCFGAALLFGADVTGKWTAQTQGPNGNTMTTNINLKADGDKLTGTVSGRAGDTDISDGKIDGDNISFSVVREFNGNTMKMNYKGVVKGDTIHFTVTREGREGPSREFDAKRASSGM
jgi:hypothetical protein